MVRLAPRARFIAVCLSATAGYVDALGFLSLGGFFASFMSGNSTRLGVGLLNDRRAAAMASALIGTFVSGAALGGIVATYAFRYRPAAVLALVSFLLTGGALLASVGWKISAILVTVLAMGAVNAVFRDGAEVRVGITYMTGSLVKLGQKLAAIPFGGDRLGWIPDLLLWGGLVAGATVGAGAYPHVGLAGLWMAAATMASLTVVALPLGRANETTYQPLS